MKLSDKSSVGTNELRANSDFPPLTPFRLRDQISIDSVKAALQDKLDVEGRAGFHMGLIADGNRRWAKARGEEGYRGHDTGAEVVEKVVLPLIASIPQITELSIFLLSHSNLSNRNADELNNIYRLLKFKCDGLINVAHSHNIRYKHAGDKKELPIETQTILTRLETETTQNTGVMVNICINYDAKHEAGYAMKGVISSYSPEDLQRMTALELMNAVQEKSWISTPADAVIRTGGDPRFSGFLGNRAFDVDCHLLLEEKFLPDITQNDILQHLLHFVGGERRMGK